MKCTKHQQHNCVYCEWDKAELALAEANALIETLRGPVRTSEAIDWALTADEISKQYRAMAIELESAKELLKAWTMPVPSQVPDEWRESLEKRPGT